MNNNFESKRLMSVERYGTFLLLLRLYNESPSNSTEKCHVSRATVRRFFSKLDHESFLDFKQEFSIPYDISMFEKELNRVDYVKEHIEHISDIQSFFWDNNSDILEKIKSLAELMYNSEQIYWLTSTTRMVEDMQM